MRLHETIRTAVERRKETRYRTAKGSGIGYKALTRFLNGADIRLSTAQHLVNYLRLELHQTRRSKGR